MDVRWIDGRTDGLTHGRPTWRGIIKKSLRNDKTLHKWSWEGK